MELYLTSLSCINTVKGIALPLPPCGDTRIAGNFRGPYISRIAIKFIFAETNFVDCLIKATPTQVLLAAVS